MTVKEKETLADEIYQNQPNLLASVMVQARFGASSETVEVLMNILFVCYEAMRATGKRWCLITEDLQERCLSRLRGRIKFTEDLSVALKATAIKNQIDQHPEQHLLAFAVSALQAHDLGRIRTEAEKYVNLAAFNLVETIAHVSEDA
jgi:hypothetical protein